MKMMTFAVVAAIALAAPASAATYSSNFGTSAANWASDDDRFAPTHYFYFLGANVSQSYAGTGLAAVTGVDLRAPYYRDSIEPLTLTFSINGTDVGFWTIPAGLSFGTDALSYTFGSIAALAGESYTIGLRVTTSVCLGCGNVQLNEGTPIEFTLTGGAGVDPVPEPASWAMLIAGFGLTGAAMRRRRTAIAA
jgi:hypothetical protein